MSVSASPGYRRVVEVYADLVLMLLVLGILSEFLYLAEIPINNWLALVYISGFLGVLLAYLGFIFFGLAALFGDTRRFWGASLFPVNLGMAFMVLSFYRLSVEQMVWAVALSAAAVLAVQSGFTRLLWQRPKGTLVLCLLMIPIGRYVLSRDYRVIAAFCFGVLLLALAVYFRRALKQHS